MKPQLKRITFGLISIPIICIVSFHAVIYSVKYNVDDSFKNPYPSLTLKDKHGEVLRQLTLSTDDTFTPRHEMVELNDIDVHVISTLLVSEDKNFYSHSGVDYLAVLRAIYLNLKDTKFNYGASTITMQLIRMMHSRGKPRTLKGKLEETVLALRLEREVSKNVILKQYLNRAYFGYQAYGIEAASRRYFGKSTTALSEGEAIFLTVILRGPSYYDPIKHKKRVLKRRNHLLSLLVKNNYLSPKKANQLKKQVIHCKLHPFQFKAVHFTDWALSTIPKHIKQKGGTVHTTIDATLQEALELQTQEHVETLKHRGVEQAGVVVLDSQTGHVLAMVGSTLQNEASNINITTRRRHPGSALKPFVYAAAIEKGDAPSTIVMDIMNSNSDYNVMGKPPKEHGPVSYKEALSGSYNIAAVHTLEKVGIPFVMEKLRAAEVSTLPQTSNEYGPRLALGDTKVRLLDLASGYGFLVNDGDVISPTGILKIKTHHTTWSPKKTTRSVFQPHASWLTMHMLSDSEARRKVFGYELPVDLPYSVAAKTGTARGFSDTVAVFVTNEYTVAAWTGRFDGGPTKGVLGMSGAGPLAREALLLASKGKMLTLPKPPKEITQHPVCPVSGKLLSNHCPHQSLGYFTKETVPKSKCTWHQHQNGQTVIEYPQLAKQWFENQ